MTGFNYPPGVTGNEPFLTGEPDFDPHAPFWATSDPEDKRFWCVYWGNSEDEFWNQLEENEAIELAEKLNFHYSLRNESRAKDGHCRVCGDYHGDPEELYESA